ncbi:MAG: Eco57I restriction-modification methylase domain-containing protein [Pseudohongiellaceae bacterium]
MPVSDNAATFLGINNENEFYSAHYLSEVFSGDIKDTLNDWKNREESDENYQAPYNRLKAIARDYFVMRERSHKERNRQKAIAMQREFFRLFCNALDIPWQPHNRSVKTDTQKEDGELPVLAVIPNNDAPNLWVLGALDIDKEGTDPLLLELQQNQFIDEGPHTDCFQNKSWYDLINDVIFKQDDPPRWLMLLSDRQCLLIDRYKWLQNRLLRFDLNEILGRKDNLTLCATAALLHTDSLVPEQGSSLLDNLNEKSHKHAFGVSENLKYALRKAIELLGNEAAEQLVQRGDIAFTGKSALDANALSRECLRYMYRLLFLFYIEARPELKYIPHKSDAYRKGYSLESLRDLELVNLTTEESRKGQYLHHSINLLFKLIHEGYQGERDADLGDEQQELHHSFAMERLDSHLFDPQQTPYLNKVTFSNQTLQTVIRLMSLTSETSGRGRKRRGRVSYAQLGINQLGAVYEALLSYRGFFAGEDLYEVQKPGENYNELETGYFVSAQEIEKYTEKEKVYITDANGDKALKKHPRGKFIYRLAGRDREKSASYYTPEVLTKCLVKYTLKERLQGLKADDILTLTVCEPAMGSAAFLNEAVNQLAEAYLSCKQKELNKRIPHEEYREALQQVKMHIADHNVFGVDLNPIAVELAEVSLWLNALSQSSIVPWFGYQLFNGNSLVGARRQVYRPDQLATNKKDDKWYMHEPKRLDPQNPDRNPEHIYHFLLPDIGMANVKDKEAKKLKLDAFEKIKQWKKQFLQPLTLDEIQLLQQISSAIDKLWKEHTDMLRDHRQRTEDCFPIWGQSKTGYYTSTSEKDQIRATGIFNLNAKFASPYRRLKLVMDYWCALWFWPLDKVELLPDRSAWLFELNLLLQGQVFSFQPEQGDIDFAADSDKEVSPQNNQQGLLVEDSVEPMLTGHERKAQQVKTAKGELHLEKLLEQFPRLNLANELADKYKFFHWELAFADVFTDRGGFDIMLGNPPWVKVEWNEGGILGDFGPRFVLRSYSATKLCEERTQAFARSEPLEAAWFNELTEAEGTQNYLNAVQNYPELKGTKVNLYKCFLPQAWRWGNIDGVNGFLHPEGAYDDPNGGILRSYIYPRLKGHYQFENELGLFAIGGTRKYSINVYRTTTTNEVAFTHMANLFVPATIDESFQSDGSGPVPGIKTNESKWNTAGHANRVISIDKNMLEIFAKLYDEPETPALQARLPTIHSQELVSVLNKFAAQPKRLRDLSGEYFSLEMWNETNSQNDGTIKRKTQFPESERQLVFSGPHIYVGVPFYKTPRTECTEKSDYDEIDLTELPDDYLPRTNYIPAGDTTEYNRRIPVVPWIAKEETIAQKVTTYYRFVNRRRFGASAERSLICSIIPPETAHIDALRSIVFKHPTDTLSFLGLCQSIVADFFLRLTGKVDLRESTIRHFPFIASPLIDSRTLGLVCLTKPYSRLWQELWRKDTASDSWSSSCELLNHSYFSMQSSTWCGTSALRTDFERRQALLEIDVLVSLVLELSIDELLTIYSVEFPVMRQYERETYYDQNGRIVFTTSKGLTGVGFPRKAGKTDTPVTLEYPDGRSETKPLGWEDICPAPPPTKNGRRENYATGNSYGNPKVPDGTKIHRTITDDTLPGGPREKTITYTAPFYLPDREEDYRIAWKVFTERNNKI